MSLPSIPSYFKFGLSRSESACGAAAGHQAQSHDQGEDQRKELLHSCFPP